MSGAERHGSSFGLRGARPFQERSIEDPGRWSVLGGDWSMFCWENVKGRVQNTAVCSELHFSHACPHGDQEPTTFQSLPALMVIKSPLHFRNCLPSW